MGSFIYALVLSPALTELLPKSGIRSTAHNVGFAGSILFALFLVGWGLSFVWGPLADRFGRTRMMAATIIVYSVFTGIAALSQNVWQLAAFRLLAGIGIGGEWALAGTYVAEAWPEGRRKMGAGYLQTGYYAGFFLASALDYTVGARYGWRAMFLCGLAPVVLALLVLRHVREPERWRRAAREAAKQSRRRRFPEVTGPAALPEVAGLARAAGLAIILDPEAPTALQRLPLPARGDIVVIVGPEGGVSATESTELADAGAVTARAGPTILRTSTAGAVATAILLAGCGRWD